MSLSLNIYLFDKLYNTIQYNKIQYNTIQNKEFTNWDPERSLLDLSKSVRLRSAKKPNSEVNQGLLPCCKFAKTIIYITDVVLVNDDVYTRFGLILPIRSQDIE